MHAMRQRGEVAQIIQFTYLKCKLHGVSWAAYEAADALIEAGLIAGVTPDGRLLEDPLSTE